MSSTSTTWSPDGNATASGASSSTTDLSLTGNLAVTGTSTLTGASTLSGAATLSSTLGVAGATTLSGTLNVVGDATFDTNTLFVDVSTNRVGIGTTSPETMLEVSSDTASITRGIGVTNYEDGVSSGALLTLRHSRGTEASPTASQSGDDLGNIFWRGYDDAGWESGGYLKCETTETWDGSGHGTKFTFHLNDDNTTGPDVKMTILGDGKVGIGTTSPDKQLEVELAGGATFSLSTTETTVVDGTILGSMYFQANDSTLSSAPAPGAIIRAYADEAWDNSNDYLAPTRLSFFTQDDSTGNTFSSPRMTIDKDGNVGIGTTTPQVLLHAYSSASATVKAEIESSGAYDADILFTNTAGSWAVGADGGADAFQIQNVGTSIPMTILATGNVGIGTTVPSAHLSVGNPSGGTLALTNTNGTIGNDAEVGRINFGGIDDNSPDVARGASFIGRAAEAWNAESAEGTDLEFWTTPTGTSGIVKRMVILDDGNVGIGTAAPTAAFHVSKEMADNGTLAHFEYFTADNAVDANDTIMKLEFSDDNSEAGTPDFMVFQDSDSVMAYIRWDDDNSTVFTDVSDYRIKSNIEPMDGSLVDLNKLKPSSFNIREASKKAYGFIAHELAEVYPSMVSGEKDAMKTKVTPAVEAVVAVEAVSAKDAVLDSDGNTVEAAVEAVEAVAAVSAVAEKTEQVIDPQSIAQSKLIPFMIKAIQELSAKVTALENA